jgi:hypothetical protein
VYSHLHQHHLRKQHQNIKSPAVKHKRIQIASLANYLFCSNINFARQIQKQQHLNLVACIACTNGPQANTLKKWANDYIWATDNLKSKSIIWQNISIFSWIDTKSTSEHSRICSILDSRSWSRICAIQQGLIFPAYKKQKLKHGAVDDKEMLQIEKPCQYDSWTLPFCPLLSLLKFSKLKPPTDMYSCSSSIVNETHYYFYWFKALTWGQISTFISSS